MRCLAGKKLGARMGDKRMYHNLSVDQLLAHALSRLQEAQARLGPSTHPCVCVADGWLQSAIEAAETAKEILESYDDRNHPDGPGSHLW